jgi:tRNA dimethylallyltransferase
MMTLRPLIAICGTTGVGKSKLAIELALSLSQNQSLVDKPNGGYTGARIINADAMQVYAGMDIITNKVPVEEQCGVDHLLMGFKKPGEQYVVGQWVKDATRLVGPMLLASGSKHSYMFFGAD